MTNLEQLQSMSLEDTVKWLDKYGNFDGAPWSTWFDENYCSKCETIECTIDEKDAFWPGQKVKCAYCELEKKCKYFTNLDDTPSNADVIKMWLMEETKND